MRPLKKNTLFHVSQIFDLFSEESQAACIWVNLDKKILYLNDWTAQIHGWDKNEVIGKNFSLLCQANGSEDIFSKHLPRDFSASITGIMHELKLQNGQSTILELNFFPVKDKDNEKKITGIFLIGRDIRRNLQDKNSYLYNIMNNVPHTIFWKNRESIYLGCNKAFTQFLELNSPEDIVGLTDYDLPWKKSESDAYRADDQVVMNTDRPKLNIEETQTLPNGKTIILLTSKVPLHDKQGQVNGVLGVYTDITAQKEMEKKLKKAHQAEEQLKKTQYQLDGAKLISGSIAHEIRTPLATIKSAMFGLDRTLSQLMALNETARKRYPELNTIQENEIARMREAFDSVNKKVDQANMIINMLLTKLQHVDFEFSGFSVCSASHCIQAALEEFIAPNGMIQKINFNQENDFKFLGNQTLIIHVMMNLLKNAVFYILKAKKGEIAIWLEHHGKTNEIHFKDTGTGIAPQILPHIFDSFFTTESSTGTGVGLAFSKMVMQSHRGEISCASQEGEYTEFVLSFPQLDKEFS